MLRKDHPETSDAGRAAKAAAVKADAKTADQAQANVDKETEQGYRGVKVDPLPNSAYSLESGPDGPPVNGTGRLSQVDV